MRSEGGVALFRKTPAVSVFQTQNEQDLGCWIIKSDPIPVGKWMEVLAVYDGDRNALYFRIEGQSWKRYPGFNIPSEVNRFTIRDTMG